MQKLQSLKTVQALRAFAALSVVLAHIPLIAVGTFGVDVFFIISGFIVCYITQEDSDHFFLKRAFRIVPLYWGATLLVCAVALTKPALLQSTTVNVPDLLRSLFFIPYQRANGIMEPILFLGWTLNYEVLFYLLFGACLMMARKHAPLVCATVLLLLYGMGQCFDLPMPFSFWTGANLLEFAAGIAAFLTLKHFGAALRTLPRALLGMAIILLVGAMIAATLGMEHHSIYLFGALSWLLFLATLSLENRIVVPVALIVIGDASYSLYLLHPYILRVIQHVIDPMEQPTAKGALGAAIMVACSILIAWLSYRLVEKPSNIALRRMLPRDRHPQPVVDQRR